jgi:7-cyano-7-deazaguanine synthase
VAAQQRLHPDCRHDTIKALQLALDLGMETRFVVHTPLMFIDRAATCALTEPLGGATLVDLVREETRSCYAGDRTQRHDWAWGCGTCPACELRASGWERYRGV